MPSDLIGKLGALVTGLEPGCLLWRLFKVCQHITGMSQSWQSPAQPSDTRRTVAKASGWESYSFCKALPSMTRCCCVLSVIWYPSWGRDVCHELPAPLVTGAKAKETQELHGHCSFFLMKKWFLPQLLSVLLPLGQFQLTQGLGNPGCSDWGFQGMARPGTITSGWMMAHLCHKNAIFAKTHKARPWAHTLRQCLHFCQGLFQSIPVLVTSCHMWFQKSNMQKYTPGFSCDRVSREFLTCWYLLFFLRLLEEVEWKQ